MELFNTFVDPGATAEEIKEYQEASAKIESGKIMQSGGGVEKKAYSAMLKNKEVVFLRKVGPNITSTPMLEETNHNISSDFTLTLLLKKFGISIPKLLFHTHAHPYNHQLTAYEKAPGRFIDSRLNRDQFLIYLQKEKGIAHPNALSYDEVQDELEKYAIGSLKDRVINGERHLPKAFRDFSTLYILRVFSDIHGANIFYDQEKGYTYLDLDFEYFPDEAKSKAGLIKYFKEQTFFDGESVDIRAYIQKYNAFPMFRKETYVTFLNSVLCYTNETTFESFLYNGILLEQSFQMLEEYAKRFGIEKLEDIRSFRENIFESDRYLKEYFMPKKSIDALYKSVNEGNASTFPSEFIDGITSLFRRLPSKLPTKPDAKLSDYMNVEDFLKAYETLNSPNFDFSFITKDSAILESRGFENQGNQNQVNSVYAYLQSIEKSASASTTQPEAQTSQAELEQTNEENIASNNPITLTQDLSTSQMGDN